eukprot:7158606-Pyramimonas_sp.AAC.1
MRPAICESSQNTIPGTSRPRHCVRGAACDSQKLSGHHSWHFEAANPWEGRALRFAKTLRPPRPARRGHESV